MLKLNKYKPNYKIEYDYVMLSNNYHTITDILTEYVIATLL